MVNKFRYEWNSERDLPGRNRIFTAIGTTARLNEPARDYMALGLWLAVLIGALFFPPAAI